MKGLDEVLRDVDGNLIEAWYRFQPDLVFEKEFVINEYNQAEKTIHVDYDNLIIMSVKLRNGYIAVEYCICNDPKEFDLEKGIEMCKGKIINHLLSIYHFRTIENPEKIKKFSTKTK